MKKSLFTKIFLAPLSILMGVSFEASYVENGKKYKADFEDYGKGLIQVIKLRKGTRPNAKIVTVDQTEDIDPEEIARNSEIGFIKKLKLLDNSVEYIPMPNCGLKRRAQKMGLNVFDCFMKIDADISRAEEQDILYVETEMQTITAERYVDGHGCAWKPLLASASDKRKSTFLCIREDLYEEFKTWLLGNVDTKYIEMVVSKYLVYMGLQTSASKTMEDVFGYTFDFRRVAVIDDLESVTATAKDVWFVNGDNTVTTRSNHKEELNVLDGIAVYFKNNKVYKPFSGRFGIMTKFLAIPMDRNEVKTELAKVGHDGYINQFDGTKVHIDDVDVILTLSCFKGKALFKTVKAWQDACIENNYEMAVCVQQHKKALKDMPYQQGQLLRGSDEDAVEMAKQAIKTVEHWSEPSEAAKLVGGHLGAACELYPALLKTRYITKLLQDRYTQRYNKMIAGKFPEAGYSVFVAPDPKVIYCHIFGLPIECQIKEDECVLDWCKDGEEVVLTRNPDTDGCPICINRRKAWGCAPGVLYINPYSWTPILLRLDYDGDHVLVINNPFIVKLYKQTYELIEKKPIVWIAPKGAKSEINDVTIAQALMASMSGSQTGIHSDNLTKVWNASKDTVAYLNGKYGEEIIDHLIAIETYNTNVDIDSTKNAGNTTKKDFQAVLKLAELKRMKLPEFCRYSKATELHPADTEHWDKRCEYTGSLLDLYAKTVAELLPKTLEVKGLESETFVVSHLMIENKRSQIEGLAKAGEYDDSIRKYHTEGLFNNIAFRHSKYWRMKLDKDNKNSHAVMRAAIREESLREINEYAKLFGEDENAAYDVITRWIFNGTKQLSDDYFDIVSRHYVDVYQEKMLTVLCMNMGLVPENDVVDIDDDDDEEEVC